MSAELLDPGIMAGLKAFQRDTVDYVFKRMYEDQPPAHRFLVADEVGLGKTLVARGLIAKVIDFQRAAGVKRIDIVYICSSADIAQQNIEKLNVTGQPVFRRATRLTKLAGDLHELKRGDINLISLTPGTSFRLGDSTGQKDERALIYWLLVHAWGKQRLRHAGVYRFFRATAGQAGWQNYVSNFWLQKVGRGQGRIDPDIADKFKDALANREALDREAGVPTIRERFEDVADRLRTKDRKDELRLAGQMVGEFRQILARASVEALEPDFIIMDEFQRFRHLLEDPTDGDDTRTLAHTLFNYESDDGHARTLLLSATPYKMYTLAAETGTDDHYEDFVRTTEFLLGAETQDFRGELRDYREAMLDIGGASPERLVRRKRAVERRLRKVMVRTERLAATADRSGMLEQRPLNPGPVTPIDAKTFVTFDQVARAVGAQDTVEYWKSAPYPISFMEGYDIKRKMKDAASHPTKGAELSELLAGAEGLLDPELLAHYRKLDPGNGRLRTVAEQVLETDAWRLLWVPPSMPYYNPAGHFDSRKVKGFTKRLIFSSWQVVPQAVATVLSYEAERRMMQLRDAKAENTPEARQKRRTLLGFRVVGGRPGSMSTFGLVNPSPALARLTDPLEIGALMRLRKADPTHSAVLRVASERVTRELREFRRDSPVEGPIDEDWYWAAPLLLDRKLEPGGLHTFFARRDAVLARVWSPDDDTERSEVGGLIAHLVAARRILDGWVPAGRMPEDLESTLALVGVAGPANAALRALARGASYGVDLDDERIRDAACRIAWGFRSLFGVPEVMALVRGRSGTEKAYWTRVLGYCMDGNIQASLDEYGHVLPEWLGLIRRTPVERAADVANGMYDALTLRAPNYSYESIDATDGAVSFESQRVRCRFALRFGVNATDEEGAVERAGRVRAAFNSPFWPFVLVTTSVGQEGLDFHQYCHAIVHWNLPANPVDFEQREGRVHRFKGHAVRRNVAAAHRGNAFSSRTRDPWTVAFDAAAQSSRARGKNDIVPYWIFEGAHKIERYVPVLPMSREIDQLTRLKRSLALYRMVFGQPRQEDLSAWLAQRLDGQELDGQRDLLRIDLAPPRARRPKAPM